LCTVTRAISTKLAIAKISSAITPANFSINLYGVPFIAATNRSQIAP
jgi:hypothetical protein